VAAAALICVNLLVEKPQYSGAGLLIVTLGIPVYFLWRRLGRAG
jgi:APA family basic amino acid/polyamine antiporter